MIEFVTDKKGERNRLVEWKIYLSFQGSEMLISKEALQRPRSTASKFHRSNKAI